MNTSDTKRVSTTCIDCGAVLVADTPYISKDWTGLVSRPCKCGSTRTVEEHQKWENI